MSAQTFRPSPKKLVGPVLMAAAFFAWATVAFAVAPRTPWIGFAFLAGLPLAMGGLGIVLLLGLLARTTVDEEGLTIAGPLGRRSVRWDEVVGWDLAGSADQGVTLVPRTGRRLGVPYLAYEGDGLRRAVDARLRRLPTPEIEGREFRTEGRWGLSAVLVGLVAFVAVAIASVPVPGKGGAWAMVGLLALVILPFVPNALTDRITLQNGVLTRRSVYGVRRLVLAEVTRAELRVVNGKGGRYEVLTLVGPTTLHLSPKYEGYAMLRDAVLRRLPAGIRPRPLA